MQVSYSIIKNFVEERDLSIQWLATENGYLLAAADGYFQLESQLVSGHHDAEIAEFEAGLKLDGNRRIEPLDSDGSRLVRTKTTRTGWHFEPRSLDFYTSKAGSLYNRSFDGDGIDDGTDLGDALIKFYDDEGAEIVKGEDTPEAFQARLDTDCVMTHMDWEPHYTFDMKGVYFQIVDPPSERAYLWIIGAPDIPSGLGGQVCFANGGWNLTFFSNKQIFEADGGGVKGITYDPTYHSGKIRLKIKHAAGVKIGIQMIYKQYKG